MARGGVLKQAKEALKQKRFARTIALLEPLVIEYRDSFDFFYALGLACLYSGDTGGAQSYFQRARQIKMRDVQLLLAQGVLNLRKLNTSQAVECYLEVLELDERNKTAKNALDFIRRHGDEETIEDWIADGRIVRFYPPLGFPLEGRQIIALFCTVIFFVVAIVCVVVFIPKYASKKTVLREDLRFLNLSTDEKSNSLERDLSGTIHYILTARQITDSYEAAQKYFQDYRDNAAQVEINRLLNSNASVSVREKAKTLAGYFKPPAFDTLKDNYSFTQIDADPYLYENCYVIWSGRVTNVRQSAHIYECDFLAGYDTMTKIDGILPLSLNQPVSIDTELPMKVLAKIGVKNGKPFLLGQAVFQSVK